MTRRAYTIVELFLTIFLGSVLLAIALPLFRPVTTLAPQSVSVGLARLETAKWTLARQRGLAPGMPVTLDALEKSGLLATVPPAPEGCFYIPGNVGAPASIALVR
jgi:Tfp pilus assembly protein FimT